MRRSGCGWLRLAFTHLRKLLDRLVRISGVLPRSKTESGKGRTAQPHGQSETNIATPRPEYLAAARQAIDQLGEAVDHGELLQCAESILETERRMPVDIS